MQTLIDLIRREPVLSQGAMQAIFACGVAFGMPIKTHTTSVVRPHGRSGADLVPTA